MKRFWNKTIIKDDVLYLVIIGLVGIIGLLSALGLLFTAGCHSRPSDNGVRRVHTPGIGLAYYTSWDFPKETEVTMTQALIAMRDVSTDVSACLDESYGTSLVGVHGLAIPRVRQINFKNKPFLSIQGDREKVTECFGMSSVVCNYMLVKDEEGSWMLERWAAETESLYRHEVFGYSNIYNRNIPSPEAYLAAKECINRYK